MIYLILFIVSVVSAFVLVGGSKQEVAKCCGAGCVECGDRHPARMVHPHLYVQRQWNQF
jgi:hypothetical protein